MTVSVTGTETGVAPIALTVMALLYVPEVSDPVVTVAVAVPFPAPEAGLTVSQAASSLADQVSVPPPVLLIVSDWGTGLPPPCWTVKDRLVGLVPIAGLTETTGAEGDDSNCVNPGISAANLLIDRPPALPPPEVEVLPVPAAASGMVVVVVPTARDPVVVDDGATLIVARGTVVPTVLLNDNGSVD